MVDGLLRDEANGAGDVPWEKLLLFGLLRPLGLLEDGPLQLRGKVVQDLVVGCADMAEVQGGAVQPLISGAELATVVDGACAGLSLGIPGKVFQHLLAVVDPAR